jgi:hypothetical protein
MFRRITRPSLEEIACSFFGFFLAVATCSAFSITTRAQDFTPSSVPVVVADFELASSANAPTPPANPTNTPNKPPSKDAPPAVFESSDIPSIQARRLMDFFAITLVQDLQKAGYTAARQQSNTTSSGGILLRGVFGEADGGNHIRRAILGAGNPGAKLLLYVGTFNLARAEQPLYEPAAVQEPDNRYGPIITLNNYIPMVKFELSKNPTEDEVQKISRQIVQNLSNLLKTNPSAFVH